MAYTSYAEGIKTATDLANKAIAAEASLSSLSPLTPALPTLQKAFPLYISAAEAYSHLLASNLAPANQRESIKKRWRLVLERAEKVKKRIEDLGGQVGKVEITDEAEEVAIVRRGGFMNGLELGPWRDPARWEFEGREYKEERQPDMPNVDAVWRDISEDQWARRRSIAKDDVWTVEQGTGADCSVAAGLGVCMEHNRRWRRSLAEGSLYPRQDDRSNRSRNGKHVLKLLLNGAWRSVVMDALLPYHATTSSPLHATSSPLFPSSTSAGPGSTEIGPPWVPLVTKGYFKALGGYTTQGSDPSPDIYAFTGWIPERLSLKEGFQREKEWKRVSGAWRKGQVLVTLGTGKVAGGSLVALHAYGVIDIQEEGGSRLIRIVDPGITPRREIREGDALDAQVRDLALQESSVMSWDQVCTDFEALNLNWDPALLPQTATRHWSWPKPSSQEASASTTQSSPRFRLDISNYSSGEIWILLSQHCVSKDRSRDDITLHVFEEHESGGSKSTLHPHRLGQTSPYTNGLHVLARHTPRRFNTTFTILASRDRGLFPRDFTLQAFAPAGTSLILKRVSASLPFSQTIEGQLNSRNSGGHPGMATHGLNPNYRCTISPAMASGPSGLTSPSIGSRVGAGISAGTGIRSQKETTRIRIVLQGDKEVAWNVKLVWGNERVFELTEDAVIADSGAYNFGMAHCDVPTIESGMYTIIVSSFEAGTTGSFSLCIESTSPTKVESVPPEGAGLYSRVVHGRWDTKTAGGRPSGGSYTSNPKVEVILPQPGILMARLYVPTQSSSPHPINLTLFKRSTNGTLGDQIATTGPYSDAITGVAIPRNQGVKLDKGIYQLVPSIYEPGVEGQWVMNAWSDVAISVEVAK